MLPLLRPSSWSGITQRYHIARLQADGTRFADQIGTAFCELIGGIGFRRLSGAILSSGLDGETDDEPAYRRTPPLFLTLASSRKLALIFANRPGEMKP